MRVLEPEEERDMIRLFGDIVAGEYDAVLVVAEKRTPAGELSGVVRYGGVSAEGARSLASKMLWSMDQEEKRDDT